MILNKIWFGQIKHYKMPILMIYKPNQDNLIKNKTNIY